MDWTLGLLAVNFEDILIASLERGIGKQIVIYPNPEFHMEQFDIYCIVLGRVYIKI